MLIRQPDGEPWRLIAVEALWCIWSARRGEVVTVLEVRACFIYRGETGTERCGRLRCLSGGFFLGGPFEELLKSNVVLSRLGQQGWGVLLGKQAWLGDSTISDSHECFSTQVKTCC